MIVNSLNSLSYFFMGNIETGIMGQKKIKEGLRDFEDEKTVDSAETNRMLVAQLLEANGYSEIKDLKFPGVAVWCPRSITVDGHNITNGETVGKDCYLHEVLELAEKIHDEGGSVQAFLPDGRYLASYLGVYDEKSELPLHGTGIHWAVKGEKFESEEEGLEKMAEKSVE